MRLLGLDYGSVTVGAAVSDGLGITAQAVETITRDRENQLRGTLRRIEELIEEYNVEAIVVGLPKNMDDTLGERALKSLEFKETLERRTGLPVFMWDERLTSVAADEVLSEMDVNREERKKYIDKIAAAIILQDYMDNNKDAG